MPATTIYLIRHGETEWNASMRLQGQLDVPLNERGLQQAARVGQRMADWRLDIIYSSDLQRAFVTAEHIARHHGLEVLTHLGLRERGYGSLEGKTREEIEAITQGPFRIDNDVADVEPVASFQERVVRALHEIAQQHLGRNIAIVAHGGTIRAMVAGVQNRSMAEKRLYIRNTSITTLEYEPPRWTVVEVNDAAHLEASKNE